MLELRHFLIALQFLSTLPIHFENPPDHGVTGPSLPYYPLVGLVIGILLAVLARAGNGMPDNLHAAIVLAIWVILTGGLHLDGLADSADAWIGGLGDRQKTLDIMKDPCCGPSAVVTLVL
ncbi:MAG: adenosylcobinamide-GDP ribazoletransferase, partial [Methylococcales bacterium]